MGSRLAPSLFQFLDRHARSAGTLVALALAFTLAFAELADAAKLAPIVGAFVAGLALSGSSASERIQRELAPVGHLLIPVFFLEIGIQARVETFVEPEVLGIAGALLAVAIVGKLVAVGRRLGRAGRQASDRARDDSARRSRPDLRHHRAPRGHSRRQPLRRAPARRAGDDVGDPAALALAAHAMRASPVGRRREHRAAARRRMARRSHENVADLVGDPPSRLALQLALDAALAVATGARPGPKLLDWIGEWSDASLRWDDDATPKLFAVLERGDVRAWRFLETTGVLERALPSSRKRSIAAAPTRFCSIRRRCLRFTLVDRIKEIVATDPVAAAEYAKLATSRVAAPRRADPGHRR